MSACECGCGGQVRDGARFLPHHHLRRKDQPRGRFASGKDHFGWNGGKYIGNYVYVSFPGHPRANSKGYVREHILIAERALGKPLPPLAVVHHDDRDGTNNGNANLVICPDQAYHLLIHARMRALEACGNADWKRCIHCKKYDAPERMGRSDVSARPSPAYYHPECNNAVAAQHRAKRKKEGSLP